MNLVVEDGIPIPATPHRGRVRGGVMDVLRNMTPGQSVFLAGKKATSCGGWFEYLRKTERAKFCSRTVEGGIRIWRLE